MEVLIVTFGLPMLMLIIVTHYLLTSYKQPVVHKRRINTVVGVACVVATVTYRPIIKDVSLGCYDNVIGEG